MFNYSKLKVNNHNLFLSERPYGIAEFFWFLEEEKIKTIVVLVPEEDLNEMYTYDLLQKYKDEGYNVIHFPIEDFSVPKSMTYFNYLIQDLNNCLNDHNVLIHCSAGIGRTGLVASGLLAEKTKEVTQSILEVRKVRPGSVETQNQFNFLFDYVYYLSR